MNYVFFDKVIQAFESNGNISLVLGVNSGKVDEHGNDLKDYVLTLVVPKLRLNEVAIDFAGAVNAFACDSPALDVVKDCSQTYALGDSKAEVLGRGVRIDT